jgi:hypothetical protein
MNDFVEIFRNQQPFVAEMAMAELKKKNIPCYMQEASISGLVFSPVAPAAGVGIEYTVYVPIIAFEDSKEVIEALPFDKDSLNVKWKNEKVLKRRLRLWVFWMIVLGFPLLVNFYLFIDWLLNKF